MDVTQQPESAESGVHEAGMARYLREVGRSRLLSRSEEKALLTRARSGDRQALNDLITANLKWVVAVCGEYRERGLPMTDLIAEGNLGLIRAAVTFDPDHDFRFTAYAIWWIRNSLERALADQGRFLGLAAPGAEPPDPAAKPQRFLDEFAEGMKGPVPAVPGEPPRDAALESPLSPEIRRALEDVREPGKTIIKLFFGLDAKRPMTLEEIGHLLGLGPARARQLKDLALRRLQRAVHGKVAETAATGA